MYAQVLGSEVNDLTRVLDELHISLTKKQLQLDPAPLLKLVMSQFFGNHGGFVDALLTSFPDPITAASEKVHRFWQGDGRVMSGTVQAGQEVDVCGES